LSFDEDKVYRMDIQTSANTFKIVKEGNDWNLVEPEEIGELKEFLPKDILWTLARLEYQSIVDSKVEPGVPTLTVSLFDSNSQGLHEVTVAGKAIGDPPGYYARIKGDPSLYTISERFLDEIPAELQKFKN